ncbi:MAG: hypothetical protein AAF846_01355 [Chloroflexota bacterium]
MITSRLQLIAYLFVFISILMWSNNANAQPLSAGCQFYDTLSGINFPGFTRTFEFFENEKITITSLTKLTGSPDGFDLFVDGVLVDTTPFPGSVTWTAPADGIYEIRFFAFSFSGSIALGLNYEGDCRLLPTEVSNPCPVFTDGRINDCDTFNPIVPYLINTEDGIRLDIYNADETGLRISIAPEDIPSGETCPDENTLILNDTINNIVFYQLTTCQYYLRAPMNEAGKYYILIFDELTSNTIYESYTEFIIPQ